MRPTISRREVVLLRREHSVSEAEVLLGLEATIPAGKVRVDDAVDVGLSRARALLVGEVNPYGHADCALFPLPRGSAGDRLRALLECDDWSYLRTYRRANLCVGAWSTKNARAVAESLADDAARAQVPVVACGARVAAAFADSLSRQGEFSVERVRGALVVRAPHPSGRCRSWNDPSTEGKFRDAMRKWGVLA